MSAVTLDGVALPNDWALLEGCALLEGIALHSGVHSRVRIVRSTGQSCLIQDGVRCELGQLRVDRSDYGVSVSDASGRLRVDLVEHLFAALSVLRAFRSVAIEVDGPELPILDGASRRWFLALSSIGIAPQPPCHRITRTARYHLGHSSYAFAPASNTEISVDVDFAPAFARQSATFAGEPSQFLHEIADARTFVFARDAERLQSLGRAKGFDSRSVLVFNDDGSSVFPHTAARPHELAAHKLLDLLGDWLLYGGVPLGQLHASRPGHTANHAVLARAVAEGVIAPCTD